MKKTAFITAIALASVLLIGGCSKKPENVTLVVGATALPHAEILNFVKEDLAKEGVTLEVKEFGDYTLINPALAEKQIDANFFQHTPYLDDYVKNSGNKLVEVGKIHIEPIGIYSQKITDLSELADGASIGVPNDATNEARALLLLQSQGLIKLNDGAGLEAMPTDIAENPKNLQFVELDAAVLPRALSETDVSVINTNYALEASLNPLNDALAIEGADSPYANVIVVREEDKDSEAVKKLVGIIQTQKVKDFILEAYEGAVVPVF